MNDLETSCLKTAKDREGCTQIPKGGRGGRAMWSVSSEIEKHPDNTLQVDNQTKENRFDSNYLQ
jgi:hypothetical protein